MIGRPIRRVLNSFDFVRQQVRNLLEDSVLVTRRWKNGTVLRHRRMDGSSILVRADEDSGRDIYFHGHCEPNEYTYLSQHVRANDVCFDVGANVGIYTLLFSTLARQGEVHAFEPVDLNYHILCTNVIANKFDNVRVNRMAVGDMNGEAEFVVASDGAYSSFIDTGRKLPAVKTRVPVTTLDSYVDLHKVPRIDCLKVDVEGAEARVLEGGAGLLGDQEKRPHLVMLELYDPMLERYGSSIDAVLSKMRSFGYDAFVIIAGEKTEFRREHYSRFYNVFFSPKDRV